MPDNLHFLLMQSSSRANAAIVNRTAKIGLLPGQAKILECLYEQDGLSPVELSERCANDKSTITSLLKKMESGNLIRKTNHPTDGRSYQIWLTKSGRLTAEKAFKIGQTVDNLMNKSFTKSQQAALLQLLTQLNDSLKNKGEDS